MALLQALILQEALDPLRYTLEALDLLQHDSIVVIIIRIMIMIIRVVKNYAKNQ